MPVSKQSEQVIIPFSQVGKKKSLLSPQVAHAVSLMQQQILHSTFQRLPLATRIFRQLPAPGPAAPSTCLSRQHFGQLLKRLIVVYMFVCLFARPYTNTFLDIQRCVYVFPFVQLLFYCAHFTYCICPCTCCCCCVFVYSCLPNSYVQQLFVVAKLLSLADFVLTVIVGTCFDSQLLIRMPKASHSRHVGLNAFPLQIMSTDRRHLSVSLTTRKLQCTQNTTMGLTGQDPTGHIPKSISSLADCIDGKCLPVAIRIVQKGS